MVKILMNGDTPVLRFDMDEYYMEVLNNDMLPYELRDFVQTTDPTNIKKTYRDRDVLRDFLASRVLSLSRTNAKAILTSTSLPQSVKMEDRLKIVYTCRGLTLTDNFWLKEENEDIYYSDIDLRKHKLSEVSYDIAIIGKHISVSAEELRPDLMTDGMYPKFWRRVDGILYLYKTDKTPNNINSACEIKASEILRANGIDAMEYMGIEIDGSLFSVSKCIATENISLVPAQSIKDWCEHTGRDFLQYVEEHYLDIFSNMTIADYVLANTDEHILNWYFLIDAKTNEIMTMYPWIDYNNALIADYFGTDISDSIYEPTGLTFIESVERYIQYATIQFDTKTLPEKCQERWCVVSLIKEDIEQNDAGDIGDN